jgi:hypothetical protein
MYCLAALVSSLCFLVDLLCSPVAGRACHLGTRLHSLRLKLASSWLQQWWAVLDAFVFMLEMFVDSRSSFVHKHGDVDGPRISAA